jgi:DNA mismatch endonuclease (patch repair protein)
MAGRSIRSRAPEASNEGVRRIMLANLGTSGPERRLRSALHCAGMRFRVNYRPTPRMRCAADVVFPRQRLCVFVDGCFWHGCPQHFVVPKTNATWWAEKIQDNVRRDSAQTCALEMAGWKVVRAWEHELQTEVAIREVVSIIRCEVLRDLSFPDCRTRREALLPGSGAPTAGNPDYGTFVGGRISNPHPKAERQ